MRISCIAPVVSVVILSFLLSFLLLAGCSGEDNPASLSQEKYVKANYEAHILKERFAAPQGYERVAADDRSFAGYLQNLPLKPHGTTVKYYNGDTKKRDVYEAVIDLDIGSRNLQQCADAVIRLRAEYLFAEKEYDKIHFNFTSGFKAEYSKWQEGYRIKVQGNDAQWVKSTGFSAEYTDFRKYLDTVFTYAGTLSLAQELMAVQTGDMEIGDVFIQGGSPGHCVIVVDMAQNPQTQEKVFLLAQSYMPAQDIHVLKNPGNAELSPWYQLDFGDVLNTPEWQFQKDDLKRFKD